MPDRNYIDVFAGCGGVSLGLHNAGWKGLFAIEKSPMAFETLRFNLIDKLDHFDWPSWLPVLEHEIIHFLSKYRAHIKELYGKVDFIAGGPPCQGFSFAGRREENDDRNMLVNSYVELVNIVKPQAIFLENVKGFTC